MLFINKFSVILITLVGIFSVLSCGIFSYLNIASIGNKAQSEAVLFVSIVICIIFIIILFITLRNSRIRTKLMEKIIDLARINGVLAEEQFNSFGNFGNNLKSLYHEITEISEKRAQRIRFLDSALTIISSLESKKWLVADPTGKIIYSTSVLNADFSEFKNGLCNSDLSDVFASMDFPSIYSAAQFERAEIELVLEKFNFRFVPVYNGKDIDGFVVVVEKNNIMTVATNSMKRIKLQKQNVNADEIVKKAKTSFLDIFRKRKK